MRINSDAKQHSKFPKPLKLADATPTHKREDTAVTDNYRAVSILPQKSLNEIWKNTVFFMLKNICRHTFVVLEKVLVHSIVLWSC